LLKQKLFTDDSKTVEEALTDVVAKIGEKIVIKRFVKMEVAKETVVSTAS
jgi:translation elongation factor EF-Ts